MPFATAEALRNRVPLLQSLLRPTMVALAILVPGCDLVSNDSGGAPTLAWSVSLPSTGSLYSTPAISDGAAFVPAGTELRRLDLTDGSVEWRVTPTVGDEFSPRKLYADANVLYAYQIDGWIAAYDVSDGSQLWRTPLDDVDASVFSSLVDVTDRFLLPAVDAVVTIYKDSGTRTVLVRLPPDEVDGAAQTSQYMDNDGSVACLPIVYPPDRRGIVYFVDASSGTVLWAYHLPDISEAGVTFHQDAHSCFVTLDLVIVVGAGRITGLDKASGSMVWDRIFAVPLDPDADGFAPGPSAVADGVLYVGSAREKLYAIDTATGDILWATTTRGSFSNDLPVVHGDHVYVVNSAFGELWKIDRRTGNVTASLGPPESFDDDFQSWLAIGDNHLVVLGFKRVYAYEL
jgi:outer membrane protein assembly factor BamB